MNKNLIALAVAAAASTGATAAEIAKNDNASLEMGGRVEARLSLKDNKVEDKSRVRLNFLGKTQITDELYGLGFYEGEFKAYNESGHNGSTQDTIEHRYVFAGIGGNFGEVTMGTVKGSLQAVTDFTDIMAYHGNSAAYKIAVADRTDNMLAYKGQFSDLSLKASYRFADIDDGKTTGSYEDNDANGYSLSAIYAIGETGIKLGAGYADSDEVVSSTLTDRSEYMLAASYEINDLYFAGAYVDGKDKTNSSKTDNTGYEFAAKYTLGQTVLSTTYNKLEAKTSGTKSTAADNVAVDATYYFKPNFRGYASYNFNLLKAGDNNGNVTKAQAEDEIALGLRYDF